jgi:hypothetical protein
LRVIFDKWIFECVQRPIRAFFMFKPMSSHTRMSQRAITPIGSILELCILVENDSQLLAIECYFRRFAMYLPCVRGVDYSDRICGIGLPQPPPVPQRTPPSGSSVRGRIRIASSATHAIGSKVRSNQNIAVSVPEICGAELPLLRTAQKAQFAWRAVSVDRWVFCLWGRKHHSQIH